MDTDSKKYTGINYVKKLIKLLETDYEMSKEQLRTVEKTTAGTKYSLPYKIKITPNGFITKMKLPVTTLTSSKVFVELDQLVNMHLTKVVKKCTTN